MGQWGSKGSRDRMGLRSVYLLRWSKAQLLKNFIFGKVHKSVLHDLPIFAQTSLCRVTEVDKVYREFLAPEVKR